MDRSSNAAQTSRHPRPTDGAPGTAAGPATPLLGRLEQLPRRSALAGHGGEITAPQMRVVAFRASRRHKFGRLFVCAAALVQLALAVLWDQLRGRNSEAQRAARFGRALQQMGATFVRIGKRLAMRSELLQSAYGDVLAGIMDVLPPFPVDQAIAIVERTTKRPLEETFAQFDPEPILSTSISCTYQALLPSGEKVVVKVRRPGAGERIAADLDLFGLLCTILEFLTVLRPGSTRTLRRELREALTDELDFVREARHQTLFRRAARRSGKRFFSAPRVHFPLSGEEVIVQEFVAGMWLWELLAAVEQNNEPVLALARSLNIDPRRLARRVMWISFWSWHENVFYVAEPNPHSIILGPDGKLWFIDFTSTGTIDRTARRALQQNMYYALKRDPLSMARVSLALLEPLPPVDVIELTQELERANWQMLCAFEASPAGRRTRTSLVQWRGLIEAAVRYHVTVKYDVVRLLRTVVLYETLALRLDDRINILKEYRRFIRDRAARAADPGGRTMARAARTFDETIYLRLERLTGAADGFLLRLRHLLASPRVNFHALVSKSSFGFATLVRFAFHTVLLTLGATLAVYGSRILSRGTASVADALQVVASSGFYGAAVVVLVLIHGRSLLFRLDDKDV